MSKVNNVNVSEVSYSITINGKKLDDTRMSNILDITLEDSATGSDLLQISICDPDLTFIEDNILLETATINFEATYTNTKGQASKVKFDGYISLILIDFPSDGIPTIDICCMDKTYLMDVKPKKRTWSNMKRSDVASKIFKEYGLKTQIDSTSEKLETISQSNKTDIAFLIELAKAEKKDEYLVYVEGDTGYFVKKPKSLKSQATLTYKEAPYDITSFRPTISKRQEETDDSDVNSSTQKKENK